MNSVHACFDLGKKATPRIKRGVPSGEPPAGSRFIPLTKGQVAIVDDGLHGWLSSVSWLALEAGSGLVYASRGRMGVSGKRETITMHQAVMGVANGVSIDHINHNGLDNRRCNLRIATATQNNQNKRRHRRKVEASSGFKGVKTVASSGKWQASIQLINPNYGNRSRGFLIGSFDDPVTAARAYDVAAVHFYGEFACLNFPDDPLYPWLSVGCIAPVERRKLRGAYRGVKRVNSARTPWLAQLQTAERCATNTTVIGRFKTQEAAARAYDAAAFARFGSRARLNFPEEHGLLPQEIIHWRSA
jgi:hypothetical protein